MDRQLPTTVFFSTPEIGHFQALRPLIRRIAAAGMSAWVFTHRDFRQLVEREGGTFVDLFGKYSLDEADDESRPIPCRYVSFAGAYAERVIDDVRSLNPAVVLYETFSVIGPVVARALDIPYVNVCVNHNANPARVLAELRNDERVAISPKCHRAVERLRRRFGLREASPFSYVSSLSPLLNVYCEPRQFLDEADREAFEPVSFFGCLPDDCSLTPPKLFQNRGDCPKFCGVRGAKLGLSPSPSGFETASHDSDDRSYFDRGAPAALRVYASFGTVIWRYFPDVAIAALKAISRAIEASDQASAVISLWGAAAASDLAPSLSSKNVRAVPYLNQREILEQADLFVTHHGLNSTHEAISRRVPMVSYPFFSDQPALARKCQKLGLAIPLAESVRGAVTTSNVEAALAYFVENRAAFAANLLAACAWEEATIARRELVIDRIRALIQPSTVREPLRSG